MSFLWRPGFLIQCGKSILKPTQEIELLSFVIDLVDMIFSVNSEKSKFIKLEIKSFLTNSTPSIRHKFRFDNGSVISNFPSGTNWKTTLQNSRKRENFERECS